MVERIREALGGQAMMRCECGDYEIERSVDYLLDMKAVWHAGERPGGDDE